MDLRPSIARRTLLLGIAAAALPCPTLISAPRVRDPVAIVAEIYAASDNRDAAFGLDPKERKKYFSKAIRVMWTRAEALVKGPKDAVGVIDWDVSTNSQGMEVGSYTHKVEKRDDTHMVVEVTLTAKSPWHRNSPDENVIRYHFIRENGRWAIDDIRDANDAVESGLRYILADAIKRHPRKPK
jgi:hypothetical protein